LEVPADWLSLAASLGIGLLIGLERERNPVAKAGLRTFALVALLGWLAQTIGAWGGGHWIVAMGLAAVAGMLIAAHARDEPREDPGTTTVAAAAVCYCLGALAATGEPKLAVAIGIGVTALLYFKPELEGMSAALSRQDLLSILQFAILTFVVLPILPDRGMGPYETLNPHHVWLMVVLISGVGLASYIAQRVAGERRGALLTGLLGGLVSSTATTILYARRSAESESMARISLAVVLLANLVPLARVLAIAAVVAPAIVVALAAPLATALACGIAATAILMRHLKPAGALPAAPARNPMEISVSLQFAALYAVVLVASAWLSDVAGTAGVYASSFAVGLGDIDPPVLAGLRQFLDGRIAPRVAVLAISLAFVANAAFKLGVIAWFGGRGFALKAAGPMLASLAGGALVLFG
jgi:uncharacterized membrane protein (DUF4010 family)